MNFDFSRDELEREAAEQRLDDQAEMEELADRKKGVDSPRARRGLELLVRRSRMAGEPFRDPEFEVMSALMDIAAFCDLHGVDFLLQADYAIQNNEPSSEVSP